MSKTRVCTTRQWPGLTRGFAVALVIATALPGCGRNDPPASTFAKAEGQLLVRAKSIRWSAAPPGLPAGAKAALLQGTPQASGRYVIRLQLPANYRIPLHSHSRDMDVTVVSGTLFVANSQTLDKKKAFAIKPGDYYHLPAQAAQFVFTKDVTVLEIHGDGPYDLKYANAADDPLKGATPASYSFTAGFAGNDIESSEADDTVDMTF
ncbi:MAG TPA: cupin domain-containing protein [Burkholderiaceae bacterium]|nr:cupin domain-containing protein [Burkholderiaceae bacterium]